MLIFSMASSGEYRNIDRASPVSISGSLVFNIPLLILSEAVKKTSDLVDDFWNFLWLPGNVRLDFLSL